jgi:hypothetical protein
MFDTSRVPQGDLVRRKTAHILSLYNITLDIRLPDFASTIEDL